MPTKQDLPIYPLPNGGYRIRPSIYNPFTDKNEQKDFQNKNWNYEDAKRELDIRIKKSARYFKPRANRVLNSNSKVSTSTIRYIQTQDDTLNDLFERWTKVRKSSYKTSYNESIATNYKNYIKSQLGDLKLSQITQYDITQWRTGLDDYKISKGNVERIGQPLKNRTKNQIITVLRNLIDYGITEEGLSLPIRVRKIKGKDKKVRKTIWSDDDMRKFLKIVKDGGNHVDMIYFVILLITGVRKNEACAVRCSSIDFINKTILIDSNIVRAKKSESEDNKSYVFSYTKGDDSTPLPVGDIELELLRNQIKNLEKVFNYDPNTHYIYGGTEPLSGTYIQRHFKKYKEELVKQYPSIDSKLTIHGFRHSIATIIAKERGVLKAQKQLRHTNVATTSNYIQEEIDSEITNIRSNRLLGD